LKKDSGSVETGYPPNFLIFVLAVTKRLDTLKLSLNFVDIFELGDK